MDQLRVVQHPLRVQHVQVLGEELGGRTPVRAAGAAREVGEGVRAEAQLATAGEHRAHLVGEASRGQAGPQLVGPADVGEAAPLQFELAGQQIADGDVLLRSGEQPQRFGEEVGVLVGADQCVAEGVERGGLRAAGGAEPGGHPVAQLHRGLAAERENEDAGRVTTPGDAGGDRLDERGGLAGARPGEDQQRTAGVINHRLLRRVQERGSTEPGGVRTSRYAPVVLPLRPCGRGGTPCRT